MINRLWAINKEYFNLLKNLKSLDVKNLGINNISKSDTESISNKIAAIKIHGVISRDEDIFSFFMGGCNVDDLMLSFNSAVENKDIKGILLDINTVGGQVDGVPEFAQMIHEARKIKPVYAYVRYMGASAGYWIASAAEKIFLHESASVGSIGIMAEFYGGNTGETVVVSSISPQKNVDPNTPEGLANLQREVDELGYIFVNNVAKYRGINVDDVINNYGKGDVMISYNAIKSGMVDGIETFKSVLAKFNNNSMGEKMGNFISKFKSQDENPQEQKDAPENVPVDDINIEWLKNNKSEVVRQIQEEGAQSERDRIKSLCDTEEKMPDEEKREEEAKKAFYSAKFEKPKAVNDILSELFLRRQDRVAKIKENVIKDAAGIPPVASIDTEKEDERLRRVAIEAAKKKFGGK